MPSTNFVNGTVIEPSWLNDVNAFVFGTTSGFTVSAEPPIQLTAGQTVVVFSQLIYTPGINSLSVDVDGLVFRSGVDFVETAADRITLTTPATGGTTLNAFAGTRTTGGLDASAVSTKLSGIGTIPRSQASYNNDRTSIFDFLTEEERTAVRARDSSINVLPAINAALVYLNSRGGGELYFPNGLYPIQGTINITYENITFTGENWLGSMFLQKQAATPIINCTRKYFTLSNMGFDFAVPIVAGCDAIRVVGNNAGFTNIDCVWFWKSYVSIYLFNSVVGVHLSRLVSYEYQVAAVLADKVNEVFLSKFTFNAGAFTNGLLGGIRLQNFVEAFMAVGGSIIGGKYAMSCDADANIIRERPSGNKFVAVYFDSSEEGVRLDKTVDTGFVDCWFSYAEGQGLTLVATDGIRITGGQALSCKLNGVLITNQAKRTVITGFSARENSRTNPNTFSGIFVESGTTDFSFTTCIVGGPPNFSPGSTPQRYGISVETGISDRYCIRNCLGAGNMSGVVFDGGTGTNKDVGGNF